MVRKLAMTGLIAAAFACSAPAQIPFSLEREVPSKESVTEVPPPPKAPDAPATEEGPGLGGRGYGGGLGGAGGQGGGVTWMPSEAVRNQGTELGYIRSRVNASAPLWLDGPDKLFLTAGVGATWFNGRAILPDTLQLFPNELYNVHLGLGFTRQFENGWTGSLTTGVGSASDKPFHSINEMNFSVAALLKVPSGERNSWNFSLMYNPTGELSYPLPGVSYMWVPSDNFSLNIGLPFAMKWKPVEDWTIDLSYAPIRSVHSKISWEFHPGWRAYAGFDWISEASYLADRSDERERLIYYEKHIQAGVRFDLGSRWNLDIFGGYAFDRFYFTGRSYSDQYHNRIDIGDGPYVGARLGVRF